MRIAQCSDCGAKFDVSRHEPGKKVRCGRCKSVFVVPADDVASVAAMQPESAAPAVVPKRTPMRAMTRKPAMEDEADEDRCQSEEAGGAKGPSGDSPQEEATAGVAADDTGGDEGAARPSVGKGARRWDMKAKSPFPMSVFAIVAFIGVAALGGIVYYLYPQSKEVASTSELPWITKKKQEFKQKYDALDRTNPDQLFELHKWCAQWPGALGNEAKQLLDMLVDKKPDHLGALGRIRAIYDEKCATARQANTEEAWLAVMDFCNQYSMKEECEAAVNFVVKLNKSNERANRMLGRVPMKNEKGETVWEDAAIAAEFGIVEQGKSEQGELYDKLDERGKRVFKLASEKLQSVTESTDAWKWSGLTPLAAENTAWLLRDFRPYVIFIEKSEKYSAITRVGEIADILKELYGMFFSTYAEKFNLTAMDDKVIAVFIFRDGASYHEKTGASQFAGAHYDPGKEALMLPNDLHDMYGVVFHEGTHQLVDFAAKLRGKESGRPFWFEEGIATNFEAFTRDKTTGKFTIGALSGLPKGDYLDTIKGMIRKKTYTPFKQMIGMSYTEGSKDPNPQQVFMNYAQSWSMVYFFYTCENGKYRSKWDDYFVAEISGEGGKQAFEKLIGNPEEIEKEWLAYVPTVSTK